MPVTLMSAHRPYLLRAAVDTLRNRRTKETRIVHGFEIVDAKTFRCLAFRQDRGEAETIFHEATERWRAMRGQQP